jgi:two-component system response regulator HydG
LASVLVVDDDPVCLTVYRHILRKVGHVVRIAGGYLPALAAMEQQPFDLIVCDLKMADGSGLDLLDECVTLLPGTPFVLITGEAERDELHDRRLERVSAFLSKPVSSAALHGCLESLLGGHGLQ